MKLILPFLSFLFISTLCSAELLENGDFSSKVKYWNVNRHPHYGFETKTDVKNGELHLSELRDTKQGYLNVAQPITIEEGKTYQLTLEAKSVPDQNLGCSIGDHKVAQVSGKRHTFKTTDWEKISITLDAKITTDSKWFKKAKSHAAKNKLNDKGTTWGSKKRPSPPKDGGSTSLAFGIGAIKGEVALRNISLVEVK